MNQSRGIVYQHCRLTTNDASLRLRAQFPLLRRPEPIVEKPRSQLQRAVRCAELPLPRWATRARVAPPAGVQTPSAAPDRRAQAHGSMGWVQSVGQPFAARRPPSGPAAVALGVGGTVGSRA